LVSDDALFKQLANEKFDVGISEALGICGLGIFEALKIPATITTFSTVHSDILSKSIGEPVVPSYVPGVLSTKGDHMNMIDRLKNVVEVLLGERLFHDVFAKEISIFRKKFGSQFKSYEEIFADSSFVFTNSNPYLDYPRPMLHKTVSIGGIAVNIDPKKNVLSKEWDDILSKRNTTVLVSFGSVAKSVFMPDEYKNTLVTVFESIPETTFIWKYEQDGSQIVAHLKNVYLRSWVPQIALLADPRLTAFVTHGGMGSTTELAHMGKPAILIPVFADQIRNAQMLAKHGGGIVLSKSALEHPEEVKSVLEKILHDQRFGRLPNLDPYGRHLSFIEYYLIDIFLVVLSVIIFVAFVIYKMARRRAAAKLRDLIVWAQYLVSMSRPKNCGRFPSMDEGSRAIDAMTTVPL
ncbi:UDP-glucoronosyl and UDP-glucosyl transferase, partial [Teladorsagia circumcincta]